jgi:hypothetical protein
MSPTVILYFIFIFSFLFFCTMHFIIYFPIQVFPSFFLSIIHVLLKLPFQFYYIFIFSFRVFIVISNLFFS